MNMSDHRARSFPRISKSDEYYARARTLIPGGTQTLAKGPGQWVRGVAPKYLDCGRGAHVWDVDGNEYIDLSMAVGPISLGYCYPAVDEAIREQLERGITFSLMHPLEVEVAELVRELVPNVDMVRFSKTGCDVTSAAVRLARAYTKRDRVLCCGYHGWHDWYIGTTDRAAGIPEQVATLTNTFAYNDLDSIADAIDDDVACVILEPMVFEQPAPGFLSGVRELCDRHGALLVFDEMWTGFRLALGGAQAHFGVRADLVCFSKAIANGMPLSVLAGRGDVMRLLERDVFFFTTFGGEVLSLAAARATMNELRQRDALAAMAARGRELRDGYRAIAAELGIEYTQVVGYDQRQLITFKPSAGDPLLLRSLLQQEMIRWGILWNGFHNVCFSLTRTDVQRILEAYRHALAVVHDAVRRDAVASELRGEPVEPVFRRTSGFHTRPRAPSLVSPSRAPEAAGPTNRESKA
jgi:glutamate-1-semialdehyde aminotransferase